MSSARARFSGDHEPLVNILKSHARVPDFLCYSEEMRSVKQSAKIARHGALWKALAHIQPNLAFAQKDLENIFERVGTEMGTEGKWRRELTSAEMTTWKRSISRQFRCMARHIQQSRDAQWCKRLLGEAPPITVGKRAGPRQDPPPSKMKKPSAAEVAEGESSASEASEDDSTDEGTSTSEEEGGGGGDELPNIGDAEHVGLDGGGLPSDVRDNEQGGGRSNQSATDDDTPDNTVAFVGYDRKEQNAYRV